MGLWKNAGVANCLQLDYGYEKNFAVQVAKTTGRFGYLPGTQTHIKRLSKQEIAAWIATSTCMPPDGANAYNPEYQRHVELTIEQEHRRGKIRVPMYRELEEAFVMMRVTPT